MLIDYNIFKGELKQLLSEKRLLINTINAYSYNMANSDNLFRTALKKSDVLIPDGVSIVWAIKLLTGEKIKKIAGADLFDFEMKRLQESSGKCFFLGSTEKTLALIERRVNEEYPNVSVQVYSPPFKPVFLEKDNHQMISAINEFEPDTLFVGMTAPKQEKWAYDNFNQLSVGHVCSIGAVFDFYAGTVKRAPVWMINLGLEWLFRLLKEPKRMWKRYLIGNTLFIFSILRDKILR